MRSGSTLLGHVVTFALALVSVASVTVPATSRAQGAPVSPDWTPLGKVVLDKEGCASCPAVFATTKRHRHFRLATDSPFAISLSGRLDVRCADGTDYEVFLRSPLRGGVFQIVPNSCVNLDSKEITLTITSVSLSPPDAERTVDLVVYGTLR